MGNKLPVMVESQMVDFEKFLKDINQLNILFQDPRYQRKIGFSISLEVATTNIPIKNLINTSLWKNEGLVKVVATIKESQQANSKSRNETIEHLLKQIRHEGVLLKRMAADKFYIHTIQIKIQAQKKTSQILHYQLTELIPLFSYLDRLNVLRDSVRNCEQITPGEVMRFVKQSSRKSKTEADAHEQEEEEKEAEIKVEVIRRVDIVSSVTTSEPIGDCSICLDSPSDTMLPCLHAFCQHCIVLWQAKQTNCPICRSEILKRCNGMTSFQGHGTESEFYCIINSGDSIEDLADEINMRVSAATRFILDSKSYNKVVQVFCKRYSIQEIQREVDQFKLEKLHQHGIDVSTQPWAVENSQNLEDIDREESNI